MPRMKKVIIDTGTAKKDCFGYCNGFCKVLTVMDCKEKGKCSFYKPYEQYRKERFGK